MDQPLRSGALVQVVDILRDQQQLARPFGIEPRQRLVSGIRLDAAQLLSPRIVEGMDQRRIAAKCLGRADILDAMSLPKPVGPAKGRKAALGRNAGAGQDDDVPNAGKIHEPRLERGVTDAEECLCDSPHA